MHVNQSTSAAPPGKNGHIEAERLELLLHRFDDDEVAVLDGEAELLTVLALQNAERGSCIDLRVGMHALPAECERDRNVMLGFDGS